MPSDLPDSGSSPASTDPLQHVEDILEDTAVSVGAFGVTVEARGVAALAAVGMLLTLMVWALLTSKT
jgi:hypothetical protein